MAIYGAGSQVRFILSPGKLLVGEGAATVIVAGSQVLPQYAGDTWEVGPFVAPTLVEVTAQSAIDLMETESGHEDGSLTAQQVAAVGALVSGAGNPAYLWINRPTPTATPGEPGSAGNVVRITDVGTTAAGSLWISDGVNWRTLNGRQALAAGRAGAPGAGLTTVAAIGKMALPDGPMIASGSLVLPVGLLRAGVGLRVEAMVRHTGTAGSWTATWRIGTANTSGDSSIVSNGGSATNDQAQWAFMDFNFTGAAAAVTGFNMIPQGAAGASSLAARVTNINTAAVMYLAPHVSALTAADTLELISYCITLHD